MKFVLAAGLVMVLVASPVMAQIWVTPEVGAGTIRGRVMAADGSGPISRADIQLTGRVTRVLLADGLGRYAFTELPAGRYTLTAGRNGYLTMGVGQRRPRDGVRRFELADGQSRDDVDFALPKGGVIEVLVTDERGEPLDGILVQPQQYRYSSSGRRLSPLPFSPLKQRNFETDDRGQVRLYDLPPGDYYLQAVQRRPKYPPPQPGAHEKLVYPPIEARRVTLALGQETSVHLFMMPTRVAIASTDASSLMPPASQTATLRGRIVVDEGSVSQWTPGEFLLNLTMPAGSRVQVPVEADGTFTATGLTETALGWTGEGIGWFLKAVMRGDRDVTDSPLTLSSGLEIDDLRAVITQTFTTVSGEARDEAGARVSAYVAVIFPEDAEQWTPGSRFIARTDAGSDGRFSITGLPPGRYRAAALDVVESGEERDPELLDRLKAKAVPVVIRDGESVTLNLPLVTF
jgi:hypothetical protein